MNARDAWAPLAERGRLALAILTKARAAAVGMSLPEGAELVGEVQPDDGPAFVLGFPNAELAAVFIREMAPHALRVVVAGNESWWQIAGPLRRAMPSHIETLH